MISAMPGIFISYRRSDNPDATGRIYDRLVAEFGKSRVFKDVDSIPLGQDFRGHLNDIVGNCAAVLAIIGPKWTDARNSAGQRRLEDADDFVRIELEAALARDIPVVPVLVAHAPMPGATDLPASLASMAFRQSIEVRPDPDFHNDATRLVSALKKMLDPDAPQSAEPLVAAVSVDAPGPPRRARLAWLVATSAAAAALLLSVPALQHLREQPPAQTLLEISTPATRQSASFALSPDGRQIVFVAQEAGVERLWLRPLDSTTAQSLPGTDGAQLPFWSPDSRSIAYFTSTALMRLDLGGHPQQLVPLTFPYPGGGSWGEHGDILFVSQPVTGEVLKVSATGGQARPVALKFEDGGPTAVAGPRFLPDGQHFLFFRRSLEPDKVGLYIGSLKDGQTTRLSTVSEGGAAFLPSDWLIMSTQGGLVAQRLDIGRQVLVREPVPIPGTFGAVSTSATGLIAFRSIARVPRQLQWFDRSGKFLEAWGQASTTYNNPPRISPDGTRVAVNLNVGQQSVWIVNKDRSTRLTTSGIDAVPVWTGDGREIVYSSLTPKGIALRRKASSGAGAELDIVAPKPDAQLPASVSPDGRYLLTFNSLLRAPQSDLTLVAMDGSGASVTWLGTPFNEFSGEFSPDGKWVAYQSNESGHSEIYLRPFRILPGGGVESAGDKARWQVSGEGGIRPRWRRDGRELYYVNPAGALMAAPISVSSDSIAVGKVEKLFDTGASGEEGPGAADYDAGPGGRFVLIKELSLPGAAPIIVIQNWSPEAKKASQ
jgi:eukaryotic-like serine/threonine-protein kinase